jgi:hypothetical protein
MAAAVRVGPAKAGSTSRDLAFGMANAIAGGPGSRFAVKRRAFLFASGKPLLFSFRKRQAASVFSS